MKRFILTLAMVVAALVASVGLAGAASTWGNAQPVSGFTAMGGTGLSAGSLVICSAPGECMALGEYEVGGVFHAFKALEANGVWSAASTIPSIDTLSAGRDVEFEAYGCASQNSCVAAGGYGDGIGSSSFVYDPATDTAIEIPGLAALNVDHYSTVSSISCSSPGNCSLVGTYDDLSQFSQAFTADQVGGVWQNASSVAGTTSGSTLQSVSCWADGECVAIGDVVNGSINEPIVVTRTGGTWGAAVTVPGISGLSTNGGVGLEISCSAGPVCFAAGLANSPSVTVVFVTSYANGTWSDASQLPAFPELGNSLIAGVHGLSCWTPGNCLLTGSYDNAGSQSSWTAELLDGVWQFAVPVSGINTLAPNGAGLTGTSCASDGSCAGVGYYNDGTNYQGFVFNRNADGSFSDAQPIPGLEALNVGGYGDPQSVSCVVGGCAATGWYRPNPNDLATFVVDMVTSPGPAPAPTPDPIAPAFTG
jgi:hypothetical protein